MSETTGNQSQGEHAEIRIGQRTIEPPVLQGSEQEKAIDISRLRAETGAVTYDPAKADQGLTGAERPTAPSG